MVLWPTTINDGDPVWGQVRALLRVLPLDPRRYGQDGKRQWITQASELLHRPTVTHERRLVPAPYYQFSVRFGVGISFHGSIPVDDDEQLAAFQAAVDEAICSPLTRAEKHRWALANHRRALEVKADLFARWGEQGPPWAKKSPVEIPEVPELQGDEPQDPHMFWNLAVTELRERSQPYSEAYICERLVAIGSAMDKPYGEQSDSALCEQRHERNTA